MLAEKNTYIGSAYEQLQVTSLDRQKRLEYEARLKATPDYNQGILEAEQRGEQRGAAQEQENTERERKRAETVPKASQSPCFTNQRLRGLPLSSPTHLPSTSISP